MCSHSPNPYCLPCSFPPLPPAGWALHRPHEPLQILLRAMRVGFIDCQQYCLPNYPLEICLSKLIDWLVPVQDYVFLVEDIYCWLMRRGMVLWCFLFFFPSPFLRALATYDCAHSQHQVSQHWASCQHGAAPQEILLQGFLPSSCVFLCNRFLFALHVSPQARPRDLGDDTELVRMFLALQRLWGKLFSSSPRCQAQQFSSFKAFFRFVCLWKRMKTSSTKQKGNPLFLCNV